MANASHTSSSDTLLSEHHGRRYFPPIDGQGSKKYRETYRSHAL